MCVCVCVCVCVFVTERTPPHPQTAWLDNDSGEIIKENSYIFSLFFLSFHFLSYFFNLFFKLLNDIPRFVKWILR